MADAIDPSTEVRQLTSPLFATTEGAVWRPGPREFGRSRLLKTMRRWGFSDIDALYRASLADPEWFWAAAAEDLGLTFSPNYRAVKDDSAGYEFPHWFVGGGLNLVSTCIDRWGNGPTADKPAVVYEGDSGTRRQLTHRELAAKVNDFAAALIRLGITKGDRVALFMPVVPEAVVAYLGCAKVGAIAVPAFSGYGSTALLSRLHAAEVSLIVTADGTTRRGRLVRLKDTVDETLAANAAPSVRHVLVVKSAGFEVSMAAGRDLYWDDVVVPAGPQPTAATEANDPVIIVYTSGTTGAPKGIVLTHAGFLMKAAVDYGYTLDIQDDDVLAWTTDLGWMLGPLMIVGSLHFGATVVLMEGVPDFPEPDRFWRIVERNSVTVLGIAPTAARTLRSISEKPDLGSIHDTLRAFASTGEPWDEATWLWLSQTVGEGRLPILNYSGGTECGGGILSCYTVLPQKPAAFNGPILGMNVSVLDDSGTPVSGAVGELVVLNTWPGITAGFWAEADRYLDTYWSRWPHVWVHGDLVSVDVDGAWLIHGRSDDTIKLAGRRIGPSEVEAGLVAHPAVAEAAVIGVPDEERGSRVVAFIRLDQGSTLDDLDDPPLHDVVVKAIGKSLMPSTIHVVDGLPKTKNGKILRRSIRARYLGNSPGDLSALDQETPIELIPSRDEHDKIWCGEIKEKVF